MMEMPQLDSFKELLQQQLEAHVEDLRRLLQEFCRKSDLQSSRSSPRGAAVIAAPTANKLIDEDAPVFRSSAVESTNAALAIAVELARQALQDAELRMPPDIQTDESLAMASQRLGEALNMLKVPPAIAGVDVSGLIPSAKQTAKAYDRVREARQLVHVARPGAEKLVKDAALVVREALALQCCVAANFSSGAAFDAALIDAFERNLGSELNSQLHLSRSSIVRLGRDRAAFDVAVPKIFGRPVSDEHRTQLFTAYSAAYIAMGASGAAPTRPDRGKPDSRPKPRTTKPRQHMLASELHVSDEAGQSGDMSSLPGPLRVSVPVGCLGDPLKVSMPKNEPMPEAIQQSGQITGNGIMFGGGHPWGDMVVLAPWPTSSRCCQCGAEDTGSSQNQFGDFWCPKCWRRHTEATQFFARSGEDNSSDALGKQLVKTLPLGERNQELPFRQPTCYPGRLGAQATAIVGRRFATVTEMGVGCCLQRARLSLGNACLLLLGGPDQEFVERASTLRLAVDASVLAGSLRGTSASSSIHVPDVLVFSDLTGSVLQPWRLSMICGLGVRDVQAKGPGATLHSDRPVPTGFREELVDLFRIAYMHGHDELVVGNLWGGAELPGIVEPARFAEVVRDVLRDPEGAYDIGGAFRRVTLMVPASGVRHAEDMAEAGGRKGFYTQ